MTPERTKELLPVMTAFAEGKTIQCRRVGVFDWTEIDAPVFSDVCQYRIKPEPCGVPMVECARSMTVLVEEGPGLSRREVFVLGAMQGILANDWMASFTVEAVDPAKLAREAIAVADATIAALNEEKP